ncbi:Disease resistance protein RPS2 [Senna tora]|uniref:Disease resistance protein RPS2 n=1 Tax=Senna tora TaxID=362788 RepID=A0A834XI30_9FABA|nr:Disease resistance protein RPS2 [Senna tora]
MLRTNTIRETAATNAIAFPETSTMVFENLPNFATFGSGGLTVNWPSLEDVTVKNCPKINKFGLGNVDVSQLKFVDVQHPGKEQVDTEIIVADYFKLSDKFSSIEEYQITDSEELNKVLTMKLKPSHFTNLKKFEGKNCDERLNDFISILLERSERLEQLAVGECKLLKYLFNLNDPISAPDGRRKFNNLPNLKTIKLSDLPQLNRIWTKDPTEIFGLGNLETIEVMKCSSLTSLISASAAVKLKKLKVLKLHSCEKIVEVVAMENQGMETQKKVIEFQSLSNLELMGLSNLIKFHRGNCGLEFPHLNSLKITNCPQMVAFTTGFASAEEASTADEKSFTLLSELELDGCGKLRYVIPSDILPRFQNFKKLTVSNCDSLEEVFAFHGELSPGVTMLSQLNELVLTQLYNLVHVINTKFGNARFFESLKILRVEYCKSLKQLYLPFLAGSLKLTEIKISDCETLKEITMTKDILFPELNSIVLANLPNLSAFSPGTSELPSLESLKVVNCPALKIFVSKDLPSTSNNCFFNSELLQKLKILNIENQKGVEKLWHKNLPSESFCELEELILMESNDLLNVIQSSMLMRYEKLKKMTVQGCKELKEVFELENVITENKNEEILPHITELILNNLPNLEHFWNKEPQVSAFKNLESLQIIDCDSLERLFSLSTAKHLGNLKLLKLYGCKNMKEVLYNVDDSGSSQNEDIFFPEVECLILKDLPSLESFCAHSCNFEWPKLQAVRVSEVPKMMKFSEGNQITPKLNAVYVTFIKKCWQGNLNESIVYLWNQHKHYTEFSYESAH